MRVAIVAVFLLCLLATSPAQALCLLGMSLRNLPSTVSYTGGYDPNTPAETMLSIPFNVRSTVTLIECDYFIAVTPGASGNAADRRMYRGAEHLSYNIYTTAGKTAVVDDFPATGGGQVLAGAFPVLIGLFQTRAHTLHWTIAPQQFVGAGGTFQDTTVTVRLFAGTLLGANQQVDAQTVTFTAGVQTSMDLSLVDTGGAFNAADVAQTVDFGDIEAGKQRAFDALVRSNVDYRVTMQSEKQQRMEHLSVAGHFVPYSLTFGGAAQNLAAGGAVTVATGAGPTAGAGRRYPVQFTIGGLTGLERPGLYRDTITVTVSAN